MAKTALNDYTKAGWEVDRSTARGNGQRDWFEDAMIGSTQVVYQVNDCEAAADFTESDNSTWDVTENATDARVGTNHVVMSTTAATDNTQYIETKVITGSALPIRKIGDETYDDWRDTDYVGFWMGAEAASDFDTAGEATFAIVYLNADGVQTVGTKINIPAALNNVHQRVELDISGEGENRKRVSSIRFFGNNSVTGQAIEIDAIIRYKHGNGKGPVWGKCIKLPIVSAVALTRGDIAQYDVATINGVSFNAEAAAGVDTAGIVVVGGTGTAAGDVYATVQIDGIAYAEASGTVTTAGEGLIWGTADTVTLVASQAAEVNVFASALEVPGAATDHFAITLGTQPATFIT